VKFQVERDVLADAVAWTARALPARPAVPVLAGMHLAAAQQLTLSTFDYEVSAQATVPVITDEEGTVLVSGRLLAEIVRSLPARPVEMSTEGTRTTLKSWPQRSARWPSRRAATTHCPRSPGSGWNSPQTP
jgi:DNA polymerase-3 subunit beta